MLHITPPPGWLSDGACFHPLHRVPNRIPHLQRISSSFNAKARDLLHEVDVHDRVRACTRCGTCSTLLGKPPKLNCPGKFTVLREVSQTACGIRECMKRVHVEVRVDRISEVGKQPAPSRYRSSTLSQTVRGGRRHSPNTVPRWSKIGGIDHPRR